jgi:hypothetical protein
MEHATIEAFAGIDVAFARGKALPVSVCVRRSNRLEPLRLRDRSAPVPPRGRGNPEAILEAPVCEFANEAAQYLHQVEQHFGVRIARVAIDAPSDPKSLGTNRRLAELALDVRRISCITTPDEAQFAGIRAKASAHLAKGGAVARMPHANQLWMLVGFALFARLRGDWECLEVFPQATVALLGVSGIHKSKSDGLQAQLCAAAKCTGWPDPPVTTALQAIGYGSRHDQLDAYLAAWVASLDPSEREALGTPPNDVIWVPRLSVSSPTYVSD